MGRETGVKRQQRAVTGGWGERRRGVGGELRQIQNGWRLRRAGVSVAGTRCHPQGELQSPDWRAPDGNFLVAATGPWGEGRPMRTLFVRRRRAAGFEFRGSIAQQLSQMNHKRFPPAKN